MLAVNPFILVKVTDPALSRILGFALHWTWIQFKGASRISGFLIPDLVGIRRSSTLGLFEGGAVLALWHRLPAASSRPARGIAYADSEAEWNPPAGASRDPQGLRERPVCVGGPDSCTLRSGDALGGWRGRAVEVAVRRRGACNFPGDRGGADRPDVAFGLPSSPAGVSTRRRSEVPPARCRL